MTFIEALISGIVQGVTEFLPVSSSGHLVLVHRFFGFSEPSMFFDICLHAATLGAVLVYFKRDIAGLIRGKKTIWILYITCGTIPAVAAALLFEKNISGYFADSGKVSFMFFVTAAALFLGDIFSRLRKGPGRGPTFLSSLIVGLAQALALIPGVSRSGMTISSGIAGGMAEEEAFRFSFLLAIPVIAGAVVYEALKLGTAAVAAGDIVKYGAGMAVAFVFGLVSLNVLRKVVKRKRLSIFAVYCVAIGVLGILFWR